MAKTSWFFFEMGLRRPRARERADRKTLSQGIHHSRELPDSIIVALTQYATSVSWFLAHALARGWGLPADVLDPDAVANSAFLEFWLRKNQIHHPRSWMYVVIRRMLAKEAHAARRACLIVAGREFRVEQPSVWQGWECEAQAADSSEAETSPCLGRVRRAIHELPDALRDLAEAYFLEAQPREEVLSTLHLSRAAFRQRLHRTRERLKESLMAPEAALAG